MYDEDFYKNIQRNLGRLGKPNLPDFSFQQRFLENLGKVHVPDFLHQQKALENLGKIHVPDFSFQQRFLEKIGEVYVPDFDKLYVISDTLSNFPDLFSNIDWDSFEITEDDIKEANDILKSDNPEEEVTKEINQKKGIPTSITTIAIYIVLIIRLLADIVTVADFAEERITQITGYYEEHIAEDTSKSDRESINWLNDELKKDVSKQITQNFRIVTKNDLDVRTGKTVNSKISGKLSHGDVVQIVEKKRNWTYVHFSKYNEGEIVEGWVFTRYLKQIK